MQETWGAVTSVNGEAVSVRIQAVDAVWLQGRLPEILRPSVLVDEPKPCPPGVVQPCPETPRDRVELGVLALAITVEFHGLRDKVRPMIGHFPLVATGRTLSTSGDDGTGSIITAFGRG